MEIKSLVEDAYQRAVKLLRENKVKLESLAHRLLEKEVIFSEDLEAIFGKRPWDEEKRIGENGNNGVIAVPEKKVKKHRTPEKKAEDKPAEKTEGTDPVPPEPEKDDKDS